MASVELLQAACSGDSLAVERLVGSGRAREEGSEGRSGISALHNAATAGNVAVIRAMARGGQDLEQRLPAVLGGGTPLHSALRAGQAEAAEALIDAGADCDAAELGECGRVVRLGVAD